ncbi:hypothetical protein F5B20DRAFT_586480 [Whalleya microplaca]|nr:hypothetical protein F5B20DRAFT_586480 [Whalleya microplaca]
MSRDGSQYPPPLPPRSPRPSGTAPTRYPSWGCPPPPPGPPPQGPGLSPNPSVQPPPIPPRPPGFEISTGSPSSRNNQPYLSFPLPPPPPGPPPSIAVSASSSPLLPPHLQLNTPGALSQHEPVSPLGSRVHSPSVGLTSFPPPPPGPPPRSPASRYNLEPSPLPIPVSNSPSIEHSPNHPIPTASLLPTEDIGAAFQSLTIGRPSPKVAQASLGHQTLYSSRSNLSGSQSNPAIPADSARPLPNREFDISREEDELKDYSVAPVQDLNVPLPVSYCLDAPITFATDWYWHPKAPEFLICSRCYVDHIHRSRFRDAFVNSELTDGKPRHCRFSKPRMQSHLFKTALATGSLHSALEWMRWRPAIPDCKGVQGVKGDAGIKWYRDKFNHIPGFVSCQACYEDHLLNNGFFANFEPLNPQPQAIRGPVMSPFRFVAETKARLSVPRCAGRKEATHGQKLFVPNDGPAGLILCPACYVAIAEPLDISQFFVRRHDVPRGATLQCCFSLAHPPAQRFITRWYEMYLTRDPTSFAAYASVFASIPPCPRDQDAGHKRWYGWHDCTICPECYHEFAKHSPLDAYMDLRNVSLEAKTMCELYSPRMRGLYTQCGTLSPPDPKPLLEASVHRRLVFVDTVLPIRTIIFQQRAALDQQTRLNIMSSHYNSVGQLHLNGNRFYTYSAWGAGYGFANSSLLQGTVYGKQAMHVSATIGGSQLLVVKQLEKRWRAVE